MPDESSGYNCGSELGARKFFAQLLQSMMLNFLETFSGGLDGGLELLSAFSFKSVVER